MLPSRGTESSPQTLTAARCIVCKPDVRMRKRGQVCRCDNHFLMARQSSHSQLEQRMPLCVLPGAVCLSTHTRASTNLRSLYRCPRITRSGRLTSPCNRLATMEANPNKLVAHTNRACRPNSPRVPKHAYSRKMRTAVTQNSNTGVFLFQMHFFLSAKCLILRFNVQCTNSCHLIPNSRANGVNTQSHVASTWP